MHDPNLAIVRECYHQQLGMMVELTETELRGFQMADSVLDVGVDLWPG